MDSEAHWQLRPQDDIDFPYRPFFLCVDHAAFTAHGAIVGQSAVARQDCAGNTRAR